MSSSHDDNLIEKLQRTIDGWSSEVTDAHQKLTRQIGAAKTQLDTLISVLGSDQAEHTAGPPTQEANTGAPAAPTPIAKAGPEPGYDGGPTDSDGRMEATPRELASLQSANEELTQEIRANTYALGDYHRIYHGEVLAAYATDDARERLAEIGRA